jgi:phosphate uptake regulator
MDERNVQKTGNMFYLYLPSSWARKHGISSSSKVGVKVNTDGTLSIHPQMREHPDKSLTLALAEDNQDIINKLIVSCYISPASSFKISLSKEMDSARLLDQKKLLNVELVEFDGKNITCESPLSVSDPSLLLKTMVTKVRNLLNIMISHYDEELIERYEEEIDRSKLLIEKATVALLTYRQSSTLQAIDIHYIDLMSKSLERLTDHLRKIDRTEKAFLKGTLDGIERIRKLIEKAIAKTIEPDEALDAVAPVQRLKSDDRKSEQAHHKSIVASSMERIVEILLDWAVILKTEQ